MALRKHIPVVYSRPQVYCTFAATGFIVEVWMNKMDYSDYIGSGSTKSISFLEPQSTACFAIKVKGVDAAGTSATNAFSAACRSSNPASTWNFATSTTDGKWTSVASLSTAADNTAWNYYFEASVPGATSVVPSTSGTVFSGIVGNAVNIWSAASNPYTSFRRWVNAPPTRYSQISPGAKIGLGFRLDSNNGQYYALFQNSLRVYASNANQLLWQSPYSGNYWEFTGTGALRVTDVKGAVINTYSDVPGGTLTMADNGKLVILNSAGVIILQFN